MYCKKEENGRLLVVDDNPKNIQLLGNILNDQEYSVEIALSGKEAIRWVNEESFDLLLLDIMMPELNGYEVCEILRADKKFDNLPIIFLSAKSDKDSVLKGFKLGGQDYISKPFDTSELLARVKTHVELKKSRDELRKTKEGLEIIVQERTTDLKQSNEKLLEITNLKDSFMDMFGRELYDSLEVINRIIHTMEHSVESVRLSLMIKELRNEADNLKNYSEIAKEITLLNSLKKRDFCEIEINSMIEHVMLDLDELISDKFIQLKNKVEKSVNLLGNRALIKKSIYNVLRYIQYSLKKGSNIEVEVYESDLNIIIEIRGVVGELNDSHKSEGFPREAYLSFVYSDLVMKYHQGLFEKNFIASNSVCYRWLFKKKS